MMKWGVFENRDGDVHVMPCNEDGTAAGIHVPFEECPCAPTPEEDGHLFIHHMEH